MRTTPFRILCLLLMYFKVYPLFSFKLLIHRIFGYVSYFFILTHYNSSIIKYYFFVVSLFEYNIVDVTNSDINAMSECVITVYFEYFFSYWSCRHFVITKFLKLPATGTFLYRKKGVYLHRTWNICFIFVVRFCSLGFLLKVLQVLI